MPTLGLTKIHEFETTHLKSLGGTGVGSILAEESAFLNPAALAFFKTSSFYFQKDSTKFTSNDPGTARPKSLGLVMTDANPTLSGSLSYVNQEESPFKRTRWGLNLASPFGEKSVFGLSVRSSKDEDLFNHSIKKYYQTVLGVTHAIDEKITMGIVAYDPFKSSAHETRAILGFQYALMDYATAGVDVGGDYTSDDISKTMLLRGGLQVKVLDDFFIRFGGFNDKVRSEKGNGFGLGWVQPRLAFEFAFKNTKRDKNIELGTDELRFKETSLAASIRF